jgi:hypothetical protein
MTTFKPGDWALHTSNQLDSREVARVEGPLIWLWAFGDEPIGPFPAANYRKVRS